MESLSSVFRFNLVTEYVKLSNDFRFFKAVCISSILNLKLGLRGSMNFKYSMKSESVINGEIESTTSLIFIVSLAFLTILSMLIVLCNLIDTISLRDEGVSKFSFT